VIRGGSGRATAQEERERMPAGNKNKPEESGTLTAKAQGRAALEREKDVGGNEDTKEHGTGKKRKALLGSSANTDPEINEGR